MGDTEFVFWLLSTLGVGVMWWVVLRTCRARQRRLPPARAISPKVNVDVSEFHRSIADAMKTLREVEDRARRKADAREARRG